MTPAVNPYCRGNRFYSRGWGRCRRKPTISFDQKNYCEECAIDAALSFLCESELTSKKVRFLNALQIVMEAIEKDVVYMHR